MPGILISRQGGKTRARLQGCCGNLDRLNREYEQAFLDQTLREGGRIVHRDYDSIEVVDRRGKVHRLLGSYHDGGAG
ncbi:MAG: hypothetical protein M3024_11630 [Candidatus Dormibacteraeota bacterium]|nr:hypothetical protein [Candidatus Dormibacteraeota bacterium]